MHCHRCGRTHTPGLRRCPPADARTWQQDASDEPAAPDPEQTSRLLAVAEAAIRQAMRDGAEHGKQPGEWTKEAPGFHLTHARAHAEIVEWALSVHKGADARHHLTHAVTRLLMCVALLPEQP